MPVALLSRMEKFAKTRVQGTVKSMEYEIEFKRLRYFVLTAINYKFEKGDEKRKGNTAYFCQRKTMKNNT